MARVTNSTELAPASLLLVDMAGLPRGKISRQDCVELQQHFEASIASVRPYHTAAAADGAGTLIAVFDNPTDAYDAALAVQDLKKRFEAPTTFSGSASRRRDYFVRIALHHDWLVIQQDPDRATRILRGPDRATRTLRGPALNQGHRLLAICPHQKILVSDEMRKQLPSSLADTLAFEGDHHLGDNYRPQRIYSLTPKDKPELARVPLRLLNLPRRPGRFIGREDDLDQVKLRLARNRIVTISGKSGVGKSRLAIQSAYDRHSDYGTIHYLSLETLLIMDPSFSLRSHAHQRHQLFKRIAQVCAIDIPATDDVERRLLDAFARQHALLIIDDCDRLDDPLAKVILTIAEACPDMHFLIARQDSPFDRPAAPLPTTVTIEDWPLLPPNLNTLPKPPADPPGAVVSPIEARQHTAFRLFEDAFAQAIGQPTWVAQQEQIASILKICQDTACSPRGLSLAAGLAAVRLAEHQPWEQGAEAITKALAAAEEEISPGRELSVPRVVATLSTSSQDLLRHLTVFINGWDYDDVVNYVAHLAQGEARRWHPLRDRVFGQPDRVDRPYRQMQASLGQDLALLLRHRLLRVTYDGRYQLLRHVRLVVGEYLAPLSETERLSAERARAYWAADFGDRQESGLRQQDEPGTLRAIAEHLDTLRAAQGWFVADGRSRADRSRGLRFATNLYHFWYNRGTITEGLSWLEEAADRVDLHQPRHLPFVHRFGWAGFACGWLIRFLAALRIIRFFAWFPPLAPKHNRDRYNALYALGRYYRYLGRLGDARAILTSAIDRYAMHDQERARSLNIRAVLELEAGLSNNAVADLARSRTLLARYLDSKEGRQDSGRFPDRTRANLHYRVGQVALASSEFDLARAELNAAYFFAAAIQDPSLQALAATSLARAYCNPAPASDSRIAHEVAEHDLDEAADWIARADQLSDQAGAGFEFRHGKALAEEARALLARARRELAYAHAVRRLTLAGNQAFEVERELQAACTVLGNVGESYLRQARTPVNGAKERLQLVPSSFGIVGASLAEALEAVRALRPRHAHLPDGHEHFDKAHQTIADTRKLLDNARRAVDAVAYLGIADRQLSDSIMQCSQIAGRMDVSLDSLDAAVGQFEIDCYSARQDVIEVITAWGRALSYHHAMNARLGIATAIAELQISLGELLPFDGARTNALYATLIETLPSKPSTVITLSEPCWHALRFLEGAPARAMFVFPQALAEDDSEQFARIPSSGEAPSRNTKAKVLPSLDRDNRAKLRSLRRDRLPADLDAALGLVSAILADQAEEDDPYEPHRRAPLFVFTDEHRQALADFVSAASEASKLDQDSFQALRNLLTAVNALEGYSVKLRTWRFVRWSLFRSTPPNFRYTTLADATRDTQLNVYLTDAMWQLQMQIARLFVQPGLSVHIPETLRHALEESKSASLNDVHLTLPMLGRSIADVIASRAVADYLGDATLQALGQFANIADEFIRGSARHVGKSPLYGTEDRSTLVALNHRMTASDRFLLPRRILYELAPLPAPASPDATHLPAALEQLRRIERDNTMLLP